MISSLLNNIVRLSITKWFAYQKKSPGGESNTRSPDYKSVTVWRLKPTWLPGERFNVTCFGLPGYKCTTIVQDSFNSFGKERDNLYSTGLISDFISITFSKLKILSSCV